VFVCFHAIIVLLVKGSKLVEEVTGNLIFVAPLAVAQVSLEVVRVKNHSSTQEVGKVDRLSFVKETFVEESKVLLHRQNEQ